MRTVADAVIDHLGGTTAVSKLIEAPVSTVHSWRSIGIPPSRLAHLRLVAKSEGKPLPDDLATMLDGQHGAQGNGASASLATGNPGELSGPPARDAA